MPGLAANITGTCTGHGVQIKANIQKEIQYFNLNYDKGDKRYEGNFPLKSFFSKKNTCVCDATPTYIFDLKTIERIKKYNPEAKLIFILRNPKIRSYSEYQYCLKLLYQNKEHNSFEERIKNELLWLNENISNFDNPEFVNTIPKKVPLIGMGMYYLFLREWYKNFNSNQIYVTTSERFFSETEVVLNELIDFLGLEEFEYKNLKKYNENNYSRKYDSPTFTALDQFYREYNEKLEKLIGIKTNW
jgi:hypothetical protein